MHTAHHHAFVFIIVGVGTWYNVDVANWCLEFNEYFCIPRHNKQNEFETIPVLYPRDEKMKIENHIVISIHSHRWKRWAICKQTLFSTIFDHLNRNSIERETFTVLFLLLYIGLPLFHINNMLRRCCWWWWSAVGRTMLTLFNYVCSM